MEPRTGIELYQLALDEPYAYVVDHTRCAILGIYSIVANLERLEQHINNTNFNRSYQDVMDKAIMNQCVNLGLSEEMQEKWRQHKSADNVR